MFCNFLLIFASVEFVKGYGYGNNNYGSSYDNFQSNNNYNFETSKYCVDLSPYRYDGEWNLNQIIGVWYAVEKIPHDVSRDYRIQHTPECFYIDIKEVNLQPTPPTPYPLLQNNPYQEIYPQGHHDYNRIRHFVLETHRGIVQEDFHIRVNTSRKHFWQTSVPDYSVAEPYRFFGGVIQVLKVANNHLVLNFCMRLPHSQLYSLVLARTPNQLYPEELANIHTVFTEKRLPTTALQRACSAGENVVISNLILSFTLLVLWKYSS